MFYRSLPDFPHRGLPSTTTLIRLTVIFISPFVKHWALVTSAHLPQRLMRSKFKCGYKFKIRIMRSRISCYARWRHARTRHLLASDCRQRNWRNAHSSTSIRLSRMWDGPNAFLLFGVFMAVFNETARYLWLVSNAQPTRLYYRMLCKRFGLLI